MRHAAVIYVDDIDELLEKIEDIILDDDSASEEVKIQIQHFIYKMEKHLKTKLTKHYVIDIRELDHGQGFFPKR